MNFTAKTLSIATHKTSCAVIGVFEKAELTPSAKAFESEYNFSISALYKSGDLTGKLGQHLFIHQPDKPLQKVLLIGLGSAKALKAARFRDAITRIAKPLINNKPDKITLFLDEVDIEDADANFKSQCCAQALVHAAYSFSTCKSDKKVKPAKINVTYACTHNAQVAEAKKGLATGQAVGEGMNVARELGNLPGNICTPTYLANQARAMAKSTPTLTTKILSEKQMADLGMGSLLSVSAGSIEPAQLIVMEYKGGAKTSKPHVLVGKGITFDTGGISLKPGASMDEMKFDMCGAASVFGTMTTLIALKPKINVVGIVAAAENMPSDRATKPGDVVTSMSGTTIEVLNTDAEGRLVLCDALTYAKHFKPKTVIDIATLTGACVVALGKHASGLFSNDDKLAQTLLQAGIDSGDRAWQLPLWEDYKKQLDSNFADLANIGGRDGGSITAACFLSHFSEGLTWAHLDIAGTAWHSGGNKGATGRPVPLLVEYLLNHT